MSQSERLLTQDSVCHPGRHSICPLLSLCSSGTPWASVVGEGSKGRASERRQRRFHMFLCVFHLFFYCMHTAWFHGAWEHLFFWKVIEEEFFELKGSLARFSWRQSSCGFSCSHGGRQGGSWLADKTWSAVKAMGLHMSLCKKVGLKRGFRRCWFTVSVLTRDTANNGIGHYYSFSVLWAL